MPEQLPQPAVDASARHLGALRPEDTTLRGQVTAARSLHRSRSSVVMGPAVFARCSEVWPCATIVALGDPDVPKTPR
jgi:hypothetical protein